MIPTKSHKRQDAAFPRVSVQAGTKKKRERKRKEISPKWDSNTRPAAYEADALPTELLRRSILLPPLCIWEESSRQRRRQSEKNEHRAMWELRCSTPYILLLATMGRNGRSPLCGQAMVGGSANEVLQFWVSDQQHYFSRSTHRSRESVEISHIAECDRSLQRRIHHYCGCCIKWSDWWVECSNPAYTHFEQDYHPHIKKYRQETGMEDSWFRVLFVRAATWWHRFLWMMHSNPVSLWSLRSLLCESGQGSGVLPLFWIQLCILR